MINIQELHRPILIFSDFHWGQKPKLEMIGLKLLKQVIELNKIETVICNGDLFNIDFANQIVIGKEKSNDLAKRSIDRLLEELGFIRKKLDIPKLYIIAGNHDTDDLYSQLVDANKSELIYLGRSYEDSEIHIEHGDRFWNTYKPPLDEEINNFRRNYSIANKNLILGHRHKIFNHPEHQFYSNGSIGEKFSVVTVQNDNIIDLRPLPIQFQWDLDNLIGDYTKYSNSDELIDQYIDTNIEIISPTDKVGELLVSNEIDQMKSWLIIENEKVVGSLSGRTLNKLKNEIPVTDLDNLTTIEISSMNSYIFKKGQTLKEAWAVFSATGEVVLPVIDETGKPIGKLSIFSVPKSDKIQQETKDVEVNDEMSNVGDDLIERMMKLGRDRQDKNQ